jgi:hypothetical protein
MTGVVYSVSHCDTNRPPMMATPSGCRSSAPPPVPKAMLDGIPPCWAVVPAQDVLSFAGRTSVRPRGRLRRAQRPERMRTIAALIGAVADGAASEVIE